MELVIVKPGSSLRISGGRLRVSEPDRELDRYVALGDLTQITLDRRCFLSSAVLYKSLELGIEVVLTGRAGDPVGRLWSQRFGSITKIRRHQLEWSRHEDASAWMASVLGRKVDAQRALVYSLGEDERAVTISVRDAQRAGARMAEAADTLRAARTQVPEQLYDVWRPAEGIASRTYFQLVSKALPGEWRFGERSQHPAYDGFNALLNYGYGIVYQRVTGALLTAGLDPSIGVFHADGYNRPSLTYDLIEPYRSWVDWIAVELVLAKALTPDDFAPAEESGEGVWLSDSGRRVMVQAVVDRYSEIVEEGGQRRTRLTHLQAECHSLAQYLLKWNT